MSPNRILCLLVLTAMTAPSVSCCGPCKRLFKRGAPCGTTVQQPATLTSPVAVATPRAAPVVAAPVAVAPAPVAAVPMVAVPTAPAAGYYCCPQPAVCCPQPCCPQYSGSCGTYESYSSGCNDCGVSNNYYEESPNTAAPIPQGPGYVPNNVSPQAPIQSGSGTHYPSPQPDGGN
ncbi:MAG: hypothetical protein ABGX16_00710 [Pirellulales bacterium]